VETITLIEGVIIIDLPPPGNITGVGTGVVAIVGEFADMTYAAMADANGGIITNPRPVELFSAQDMQDKLGGFDPTIGDFGNSCGNGFVAVRNKQYSRLIGVPVNLSSPEAVRLWRQLPTNTSATNTTPAVPMQAAGVAPGTEFKLGDNRVDLSARVSFNDFAAYETGIDGSIVPAGLPVAIQPFASLGADFIKFQVKVGDALVLDVIPSESTTLFSDIDAVVTIIPVVSTAGFPASGVIEIETEFITYTAVTSTSFTGATRGALGSVATAHTAGATVSAVNDAGTYRVASVVDANNLTIERQDGSNFTDSNWLASALFPSTFVPWRLHLASTADTGANTILAQAPGYTIPARPLDASIAASTVINPTIAAPAATALSWNPLSGLQMTSGLTGLAFDPATQAPNAPASSFMDVLYLTAIDSLLGENAPARDVNLLDVARTSNNIRVKQKSHVEQSSAVGVGRTTTVWPELSVTNTSAVLGDVSPGVGAYRDERVNYSWPGAKTFVPEAVPFLIPTSDGHLAGGDQNHPAGIIEVPAAGWLISVESNLPPENNPGQSAPPVPGIMAPVIGFQYGAPVLGMSEYIQFRHSGIAALRIDRTVGAIFQSGITTDLVPGQKNINRRRMADFIEDSIAEALNPLSKLPLTQNLRDAATAECVAFLDSLLSPNNPAAQRIDDYEVDTKSGNTPTLEAQGVFVIIIRVRTLATADFIVLQAEIGEGVTITRA
jgi:hypothetical protein